MADNTKPDDERDEIWDWLTKWGIIAALILGALLVVFDVWDDCFGPGKYEIPAWIIAILSGIFSTLCGRTVINNVLKGKKDGK